MGLPQPSVEPLASNEESLDFESIYERYADLVWRTVRRLGLDEATAEDALQEVFLVVHRRLSEFEGNSSVKTWLVGIAVRVVRNQKRGARRKRIDASERATEILETLPGDVAEQPDSQTEQARAVKLLYSLLEQLDDDKREVFVMAEFEQMRGTEIAAATGMNLNTVYKRLKAARKQFERAVSRWCAYTTFGERVGRNS